MNAAPAIGSLLCDNPSPYSTDTIQVQVVDAVDPDGDPLAFQFVWTVNGQVVQSITSTTTTDTLDLSQPGCGDRGDLIELFVTVSDGYASSSAITSLIVVASPTEPYADYLAALEAANAAYLAALDGAKEVRDQSLVHARCQAQSVAADLYAAYQSDIAAAAELYGQYEPDDEAALAAFWNAEESAWNSYQTGLAGLEKELATAEGIILAGFEIAKAEALAAWQAAEAAAWVAYQLGMNNIPTSPNLSEPIEGLPAVVLPEPEPWLGYLVGTRYGDQFRPPTAWSDDVEIENSAPKLIELSGSSAPAYSLTGEQCAPLTYFITAVPERGRLYDGPDDTGHLITGDDLAIGPYYVMDPEHRVFYIPDAFTFGDDEFQFLVHDGVQPSDPVTVSLRVIPGSDAPQIDAGAFWELEPGQTIAGIDLLALVHYSGSGSLSWTVGQPDHGSLFFDAQTGIYSFTAPSDYVGPVEVPIEVTDGMKRTCGKAKFFVLKVDPWDQEIVLRDLDISRRMDSTFVRNAIRLLDTHYELSRIPAVTPNDPAPGWVTVMRDRAGRRTIGYERRLGQLVPIEGDLNGTSIVTAAQLARINIRVNLVRLKQDLVDQIYKMVVNSPPGNQQWNDNDRRQIAAMAKRTADDLIRMVDLFLRTHPGARPALGARNRWVGNRFNDPWCADWTGAMRAWIRHTITSRGPLYPANTYLEFEWGQANDWLGFQHNFIIIKPRGHTVQLSTGYDDVDEIILLFDPWRELLPRVYRPIPWSQQARRTPTHIISNPNSLDDFTFYFDRLRHLRFSDRYLYLGEFYSARP